MPLSQSTTNPLLSRPLSTRCDPRSLSDALSRLVSSPEHAYAPLPTTTRGKSVFLGGDPKGNNFVYTAGNNVVVRNIHNPLLVDFYLEHARAPTVAAYAPSGNYIASGDCSGLVRVWDTINAEHILKIEVQAIAGEIRDIAWTGDSTRIVAVGDGRESYVVVDLAAAREKMREYERGDSRWYHCIAIQLRQGLLVGHRNQRRYDRAPREAHQHVRCSL